MFPFFQQNIYHPMGGEQGRRMASYSDSLMAFSALSMGRNDLENGNKVLLPSSALQQLIHHRQTGPMIFKLTSTVNNKVTFVGVLEFIAEEGTCIVPHWIFENTQMFEGCHVMINLVQNLPKVYTCKFIFFFQTYYQGKLIKLQPHETAFIDLSDPRAILETQLRNYVCLTEGETITVQFSGKQFQIDIVKVEPVSEYKAVNVNEADVEIDFMPPLVLLFLRKNKLYLQDYIEAPPNLLKKPSSSLKCESELKKQDGIAVFVGKGVRLDGKPERKQSEDVKQQQEAYNPRKHKLNHGVRQMEEENLFQGQAVKLGQAKPPLKK